MIGIINSEWCLCFRLQISDNENKHAENANGRKEKSVLQAKLTRLTVLFGYAGQQADCRILYASDASAIILIMIMIMIGPNNTL